LLLVTVDIWKARPLRFRLKKVREEYVHDCGRVAVSDDELLWNAPPPTRCKPAPAEHVWTMRVGHRIAECQLHSHGEYGWEARFNRDSDLFSGRRFELKAQALQWAELARQALEREGWTTKPAAP
jgi:hypothetical protein